MVDELDLLPLLALLNRGCGFDEAKILQVVDEVGLCLLVVCEVGVLPNHADHSLADAVQDSSEGWDVGRDWSRGCLRERLFF